MKKQEAQTIKVGDTLMLTDTSKTPGRKIEFPVTGPVEVRVKEVIEEKSGYVHFDVGYYLPKDSEPLKSRDTGEEIDGSNRYWMHYSRFSMI